MASPLSFTKSGVGTILSRGQMATPMTCTLSLVCLSASLSMSGIDRLHGPHQEATWETGNGYVLDFWATWWGPGKRSIPDIDKLADKHTSDNVHVIGVAIWPRDKMVPTPDFVKDKGEAMSYGICEDIDSKTATAFMQAAAQNGIPTCMVIDKAGKLAWLGN